MKNVTKLLLLGTALGSASGMAQKVGTVSLGVAVAQTSNVSLFG